MEKEIVNCRKCGKDVLLKDGNGRCKCGYEYARHKITIIIDPDEPPEKIGLDITLRMLEDWVKYGSITKEDGEMLKKEMKKYYQELKIKNGR